MTDQQPRGELTTQHCTDASAYLRILHEPRDVFEVRIIDCPFRPGGSWKSTAAGWFNDTDKAGRESMRIENLQPPAVYVLLNPCNPVLLGRSMNRVSQKAKSTTKDADILQRRWLFIDIDANRPAGISSTDAELAKAEAVSDAIQLAMVADRWPDPLVGMSGNGRYLLWRIDLPNNDDSAALVERCLKSLAYRFNTEGAEVDCSTFNAARICKLLGSIVRKGDELLGVDGLPDRPHRRSWFIEPSGPLELVTIEQLQSLAEQYAEPKKPAASAAGYSAPVCADAFDRCCKYLNKMSPAISGELGSRRLYHAVNVALHDFELSASDAAAAIEREFNPRCVPPWDKTGIDRAIRKAIANGGPSEAKQKRDAAHGSSSGIGSPSSSSSGPSAAGDAWDDPEPLPDPLVSVAPYRSDLLPSAIGDAVDDIAERMQCPPDFPAASMLVALAAVIGCRIGIRPRRLDDWLVVANLWGCAVGRPALKKSPAIAHAEKRIRAIESQESERLADEVKLFNANQVLAEISAKAIKVKIDKAVKNGMTNEALQLALELKAKEGAAPPIPRRIITSDSTIEKLGDMLNKYPLGMLLWVDELVGWMRGLDRQDMAGVRQQFLTLWNGQGRLNIDRVGRGETVVAHPCLSVFGCATPGGLGDYVAACLHGGRGDDGLIQRLQVLVWPDSPKEYRPVDRLPDSAANKRLAEVFEALADLDVNSFAERDQDDGRIPWLRFDSDGQSIFDRWDADMQNRIRATEMPEAFESHLSKYASLVPSIALVFHLAMGGRGPVSGNAAELSVRWAEYLESHAARLYSIAVAPERRLAGPLLHRLLNWPKEKPIRTRDIAKQGWGGLTLPEVVNSAIEILVEAGWMRAVPVKPASGRPTVDYLIHPRAAEILKIYQGKALRTGTTQPRDSFVGFGGAESESSEKQMAAGDRLSGVI